MLAPANYYFLHQELCFFVGLQPVKMLHSAPLQGLHSALDQQAFCTDWTCTPFSFTRLNRSKSWLMILMTPVLFLLRPVLANVGID